MPIAELLEIPVAPITAGRALAELRREFARRGWNKREPGPINLAMVIHTALLVAGMVLGLWAWNMLSGILCFALVSTGILISGIGSTGIGTTTHTSSHFAASANRRVNELLTFLGYSILSGFSATYWWRDHVSRHHSSPNVPGADDTIDFLPLFALTESEVDRASGWVQKYYRNWQALVLPFMFGLLVINMQRTGWIQLLRHLRDPRIRRGTHVVDLLGLLSHLVLFFGLPLLYAPLSHVVVFYLARQALVSVGLVVLLAPAHLPAETPVVTREQANAIGHCALQTYTTINYNGGRFVHLMATGLNYQIEHHLFPEISHVHYVKMAPFVAEFCREQGLPYRTWSLSKALWESYKVFMRAKRMDINLATL